MDFGFSSVKVFTTPGNAFLGKKVAWALNRRLPEEMKEETLFGGLNWIRFANNNWQVQIEDNPRGCYAVIVHTHTPRVNEELVKLFLLLDALVNSHVGDILVIFPYMPYARSDRKNAPRISAFGALLPQMISRFFGVKRVLLMDAHSPSCKQYFSPTADEVTSMFLFARWVENNIFSQALREECVLVYADAGAAKRFERMSDLLKVNLAYFHKVRNNSNEKPEIKRLVGDVKGKIVILLDDEILSGATAIHDIEYLKKEGAESIVFLAVHGVFQDRSGQPGVVQARLLSSPVEKVVVTNSVNQMNLRASKIEVIDIAGLLAEAAWRILRGTSVSELYNPQKVVEYM